MDNRVNAMLVVMALAFASGCKKSESPQPPPPAPPSAAASAAVPGDAIARIRWLGKDQIAKDTNSATLMKIWQMPESVRLEAQTLEKLSRAPWRLLLGDDKATNSATALFEPIVADLLQCESYLELAKATNQPAEIAFAIRLKDERARLWEKNLAAVLESLTGVKVAPTAGGGWRAEIPRSLSTLNPKPLTDLQPSTLRLGRAGEWTVVGMGPDGDGLFGEFQARIKREHAPFTQRGTNYWIEADLDLRRVSEAFALGWKLPQELPKVSGAILADKENVRTRAELEFPSALQFKLNPWNVPTNLIQSPLYGLTAAREMATLFGKLNVSSDIPNESVPDQFYVWDTARLPFKTYFALPVQNATNAFNAIAPEIRERLNSRLAPAYGSLSINSNAYSLSWNGVPFGTPFLRLAVAAEGQFLFGGFGPFFSTRTNRMPREVLEHIQEGTNLVYFDWELTADRLTHWRYLDDTSRILFDAAHVPRLVAHSASIEWIGSVTNLSYALTEVRQSDPAHLSFTRKSTIGLTALEIDILANWLEFPEFPRGLNTLLQTNSAPAGIWQKLHRPPPGAPK